MEGEINKRLKFLSVFLILFMGTLALGQTNPGSQNPPVKKIKHLNSEVLRVMPDKFEGNPFAYGNVIFEHDGTKLYSDSAVFYQKENFFRAWSRVRVVNTMTMTSDSLEYDGNLSIAKAFDNVHLKDSKSELYADYVEYNRITNIAEASGNVVLVDPNQRIESPHMIYNR